ncbi:MAG: hypothetical protein AAF702_33295, partial [Chloroflexota bacterium]
LNKTGLSSFSLISSIWDVLFHSFCFVTTLYQKFIPLSTPSHKMPNSSGSLASKPGLAGVCSDQLSMNLEHL